MSTEPYIILGYFLRKHQEIRSPRVIHHSQLGAQGQFPQDLQDSIVGSSVLSHIIFFSSCH